MISLGPFSYSWNTGASTAIIENLGPGVYEVTLTDLSTGCISECSS